MLMQIAVPLQRFRKRWETLRAFPARLLEAVIMCVITISVGDLVLLGKGFIGKRLVSNKTGFFSMPVIMESAKKIFEARNMIVMQMYSLLFPRGIQDNELYMQDNSTFQSYKCKNGKPLLPLCITLS